MAHSASRLGLFLIICVSLWGCGNGTTPSDGTPDAQSTLDTANGSDILQDSQESNDSCELADCADGPEYDVTGPDTMGSPEDTSTLEPCEGMECGDNGICQEGICACSGGWSGDACDQLEAGVIPWNTGPYASGIMGTVEDFTIQTLEEPWSFKESWNGKNSYLFIMRYTGDDIALHVWNSSIEDFLNYAPENTHVFFGSFQNTYMTDITEMKERVDAALAALPPFLSDSWAGRIHYINQPVSSFNGGLKSFIGEHAITF